jgi:GNAT superfamily N-acetyltransferase
MTLSVSPSATAPPDPHRARSRSGGPAPSATFELKGTTPLDAAIQSYLRASASRGRDVERAGPFLATFDPTTDHPFLNYAIPDDGAQPSAADVERLVAAYQRRGRLPRLEYLPAVAPAAEAVLLAGGLLVEARLALMTCSPGELVDVAVPDGVELVLPVSGAELLAVAAATAEAFGEPAPRADGADRLRASLDAGGIAVLARDALTGEPAGGGVCTPPGDGATELAGIGVRERFRRRGIAAAITARLAREAFDAGVTTAFLTPGDDGAGRVYARAGFAARTRMLHISQPR